jgi:NADP-dependent 3-hydroxy acid dehydrogenase YdfG
MPLHAGKIALVTGAGRGIGRAIALTLAQAGFSLCLAARTFEELEETRQHTRLPPEQSLIVLIDLADPEAPEQLWTTALAHFDRIDVLINNAGSAPARTPLIKLTDQATRRILNLNLHAPIALTRRAARHMAERGGGTIINIASTAARLAPAGETVYAAAKAGLVTFTHACFEEFRQHRIRTSVIIPGLTDTTLIPANKRLDRTVMLQPEDVANAVMAVMSASPAACPLELILQPSRDPMRAR